MTFVSRVAQPAILLKKESVQQDTCFSEQIERPYVQFEKRENTQGGELLLILQLY